MPLTGIPVPFTDEADWLKKRQQGLGASDVAAIFRLSKWQSPYSLWAEKTGRLEKGEPSDAMLVGRIVQPAILNLWEQRSGLYAGWRDVLWQHPDYEWALATPDALVAESKQPVADTYMYDAALAVLEVKNEFLEWDEVPAQYRIQVCWQQWVTGLTESPAIVVNLTARKKMQIFEVEWDPDLAANLLEGARNFWEVHVVGDVPPPPDDTEATSETLAALFPGEEGLEVELRAEVVDAIKALRVYKEQKKLAEAEIRAFENIVKAALGDATEGIYQGERLVSWRPQTKKEHLVRESTFRVLRLGREPD